MITRMVTKGDFRDTLLARVGLIGDQRTRPGDIGLDPRWRRHRIHDFPDGSVDSVAQTAAHVAGEVDLDVGGLLVVALGARRGQRVAPKILDVLNMLCVCSSRLTISS